LNDLHGNLRAIEWKLMLSFFHFFDSLELAAITQEKADLLVLSARELWLCGCDEICDYF